MFSQNAVFNKNGLRGML